MPSPCQIPFGRLVQATRLAECNVLRRAAYLQSSIISLVPVIPVVAGVLTFCSRALAGEDLVAQNVFTVMSLFALLRFTLATLPQGVRSASEAKVCPVLTLPQGVRSASEAKVCPVLR